eukprot:CAMPEP_0206275470 /NCGR_PEP_ID=MMETSP0047_2-20121206/35777_1 /ASSEMBLY_ACC=CAM_ASM_000192 /TAXON_ID=195065 /ORGANISM="Chroomonas mesostigmatica_cf, Strain CCMP1168" /LENGTH=66 /DNA_ID=CAMNT_0053704897 /DNA_START=200 /DNA_END=397 /DNA_ORIENTATION=-
MTAPGSLIVPTCFSTLEYSPVSGGCFMNTPNSPASSKNSMRAWGPLSTCESPCFARSVPAFNMLTL